MTRTMYDAVTPHNIPVGAAIVAGYVNGRYAWHIGDWGHFPKAQHAGIDVFGTDIDADILDVEQGDASVATAVKWVKAKRLKHPNAYAPIIYANRSTLTPLFNAMASAGLHVVKDFRLWISTLDGTTRVHDMTGVTAVQYQDHGNLYDMSVVYDDAWKKVAPPKPAPPAVTTLHGRLSYGPNYSQMKIVTSTDKGVTWR